jgi:hypothetical protein
MFLPCESHKPLFNIQIAIIIFIDLVNELGETQQLEKQVL